MCTAITTVKVIWMFASHSKNQKYPFYHRMNRNKKNTESPGFLSQPSPLGEKGRGWGTPDTLSRGILAMPALCQAQICLLWECGWVGSVQPQGICVQQAAGSQAVLTAGWFPESQGNAQPFSAPPAPDARGGPLLWSYLRFTFAPIKEK